jgi:single-strand DNA-binding protein
MNVFSCTGRLGRDSKTNQTQGGTSVCNFALAVESGFGDKKQTIWLDCALWGKRAEGALPQYLIKGAQVAVSGEMATREYQDNNGVNRTAVTLRVNDLTLLGNKQSDQDSRQGQPQAQPQPQPQQNTTAQGFGQNSTQQEPAPQGQGFDDFSGDIPF